MHQSGFEPPAEDLRGFILSTLEDMDVFLPGSEAVMRQLATDFPETSGAIGKFLSDKPQATRLGRAKKPDSAVIHSEALTHDYDGDEEMQGLTSGDSNGDDVFKPTRTGAGAKPAKISAKIGPRKATKTILPTLVRDPTASNDDSLQTLSDSAEPTTSPGPQISKKTRRRVSCKTFPFRRQSLLAKSATHRPSRVQEDVLWNASLYNLPVHAFIALQAIASHLHALVSQL